MNDKKSKIIKFILIFLMLLLFLTLIFFPIGVKLLFLYNNIPTFTNFATGNWLAYYGTVLTLITTSAMGIIGYSLNKQLKHINQKANTINESVKLAQEKSMKSYLKIDLQNSICDILDDGSFLIKLSLENLNQNMITNITYQPSNYEFGGTDSKNDTRDQKDKYLFISSYNGWSGGGDFNLNTKFDSNFNLHGFENIAFVFSFKALISSIYGYTTEQYFNIHFMKNNDKYCITGYKTITDKKS